MAGDVSFDTQVSGVSNGELEVRGETITSLISEANFCSAFFLSLSGRRASTAELQVFNAILTAALDQGLSPVSGFVPRLAASSGVEPTTAIAAGLLTLGPLHGGAVSASMKLFAEILEGGEDIEQVVAQKVTVMLKAGSRVPGFGHPVYKKVDPRAQQLFVVARRVELPMEYMNIAKQVEHTIEEQTGKQLVLNIDGAMAALLLTLRLPPAVGNALFAVAKAAGSIAHIVEEQAHPVGVRRLPLEACRYHSQKNSDT